MAGDTFGPQLLISTPQQTAHAELSTASWSQCGSSVGLEQPLNPYDGVFSDVISKGAEIPGICFQVLFKTMQL